MSDHSSLFSASLDPTTQSLYDAESLRLEAVTVCMGFDDILDFTLERNMPQVDTMIVVTSHDDHKTQAVARKHGATVVPTDLHKKNGRKFNKGAAINAGFDYFQRHGWRMHLDSDIGLPANFRRLIFNHHALDRSCLYGADRVDVIGLQEWEASYASLQHRHGLFVGAPLNRKHGDRMLHGLNGYLPLGYFQMWHASCQKPYSLGTAAHDDMMFSALWPEGQRRLLPGVITHHLCAKAPQLGENWNGNRAQPRLKK